MNFLPHSTQQQQPFLSALGNDAIIFCVILHETAIIKLNLTMTIKVEREALVTVLSRSPSWPSSPCEATSISSDDDEFVLVNLPNKSSCLVDGGLLRCSSYSDEDSLCTLSTSSESSVSDSSIERRVTFAPSLVSDEWTRPFTPREDVASLFYSTEDTNR